MIFLLFLFLPIVEIYLLIQAGRLVGFWPVFGVVVLSAWLGVRLVKAAGFVTLSQVQAKMAAGESPRKDMLEGLVLLLGGVLLIFPGLIADFVGLICLFPPTRKLVRRWLQNWLDKKRARGQFYVFNGFKRPPSSAEDSPRVIKDVTPPSS